MDKTKRNSAEDNLGEELESELAMTLRELDAIAKAGLSTARGPGAITKSPAGNSTPNTNITRQAAVPTRGVTGEEVSPQFLVPGYEHLGRILSYAYEQSSSGKGKERHAMGPVGFQPWHQQPILANARQVGPAGLAQQVMKKAGESVGMSTREDFPAAKAEALGAIVYAAALYKLYEEMEETL